ncbi:MAG TPA: hypothetical protein VKB46_10435 [Pyrinomonadaceae bacterium]|nr:hypothetical protein [Pyrinomonadaceae bacterium]
MSAQATTFAVSKPKSNRAILWGGLLAGIMDISAAFLTSYFRAGRSPIFVLQSVASGLLGADSYKRGLPAAALGLLIHFTIAFVACTVYYLASRKLRFLIDRAYLCGPLYGIVVYLFMCGVVLPLRFHRNFFQPFSSVISAVVIHMICVGTPIGLSVGYFGKKR